MAGGVKGRRLPDWDYIDTFHAQRENRGAINTNSRFEYKITSNALGGIKINDSVATQSSQHSRLRESGFESCAEMSNVVQVRSLTQLYE